MKYQFYNVGEFEILSTDFKIERFNRGYEYLSWYEANKSLEDLNKDLRDTNKGDWRFPTDQEIKFLNDEYRSRDLLNFSNRAYWIDDPVLSLETSDDWSIGYYFGRKGQEGRKGGIPKTERLCLRPVRSL